MRILLKIKIGTLCSVFAFFFLQSILPAWGMSGTDHSGDMIEVLIGNRSARVPELRGMCRQISSTIDNFQVIKGLPVGESGHRAYGHWGFSDSIPFSKSPLKDVLDRIESTALERGKTPSEAIAARNAAKQRIIDAWHDDVTKIIQFIENETGLVKRQAKGLAGLFYDIHLLGDWTGLKLDSLQAVDSIGDDVVKNLRRLFGNRSNLVDEIAAEIKNTTKYCLGDNKCKANTIMAILKNSDELRKAIAVKLADKYPILASAITSRPIWKAALVIAAVSNRYNNLISKFPKKYRMPAQSGLITGLISTGINGYKVINGSMDPFEAASHVAEDSVMSAAAVYISDGILVKMGDHYALQTIASSNASNLCKAFGASV